MERNTGRIRPTRARTQRRRVRLDTKTRAVAAVEAPRGRRSGCWPGRCSWAGGRGPDTVRQDDLGARHATGLLVGGLGEGSVPRALDVVPDGSGQTGRVGHISGQRRTMIRNRLNGDGCRARSGRRQRAREHGMPVHGRNDQREQRQPEDQRQRSTQASPASGSARVGGHALTLPSQRTVQTGRDTSHHCPFGQFDRKIT
jgi:hypothetical protein